MQEISDCNFQELKAVIIIKRFDCIKNGICPRLLKSLNKAAVPVKSTRFLLSSGRAVSHFKLGENGICIGLGSM